MSNFTHYREYVNLWREQLAFRRNARRPRLPAIMAAASLDALLDQLERGKCRFGEGDGARVLRVLSRLARRRIPDAASLIRFHEALLFLRAYPHSPPVLDEAERLLSTFHRRVERLNDSGAEDVDALTEPEVSGIAGTRFSVNWGYDVVRHLAANHASKVEVDWDGYQDKGLLVDLLKLLLPLFEDGAYVEYPAAYLDWIRAAKKPGERDLGWLLRQVEGLSVSDRLEAALFDALELPVEWRLGASRSARTNLRLPRRGVFYHDGPLIGRRDVSLAREIEESPPLPTRKLSAAEGRRFLSLARDVMTIRFRELYGFTHGDPRHVRVADAGRGVRFFVWGVPPERRMPMIGYHAALISKNGVPVGYAESLALFERTEMGLNLFYTFRDGESAWIFARLLRLLRQLMGITVVSVEPYQLGSHNEEAIDSGAFWFYRKLGFRPVRPELAALVSREERRIAARDGYRTPARVLRKLATGHLIYESPSPARAGEWDRFHFRHLGLAAQRRVAERFHGDARKMRDAAGASVARALGVRLSRWTQAQQRAFAALAPALDLIPGLSRWSRAEKEALARIVLAKAGPEESRYVRLLQGHRRLRAEILRIGSQE